MARGAMAKACWPAAVIANRLAFDEDGLVQPCDLDPYGVLERAEAKPKEITMPYNPAVLEAMANSGKVE